MPSVTIVRPRPHELVPAGEPVEIYGTATDRGAPEPTAIEAVSIDLDGVPVPDVTIEPTNIPNRTAVSFRTRVASPSQPGGHTVTVTAINDMGRPTSRATTFFVDVSAALTTPVFAVYQAHLYAQNPGSGVAYRCAKGYIHELYHLGGTSEWGRAHLTGLAKAPAAAGAPAAYQTILAGQAPCARVVFSGVDRHVYEMYYLGGTSKWTLGDLTDGTDAPGSVGVPATYQTDLVGQDPCARVVYRAVDGGIHELYCLGGGTGWEHRDLTGATAGAPPAAGGTPAAYQTDLVGQDPCARVVYRAVDGGIHELYCLGGGTGWEHRDLTGATAGAPPAAGGTPAAYQTNLAGQDRCARVVFRAVDGGVHELSCFGGAATWTWTDLTAAAGAPPAAGGVVAYQTDLVGQDRCARVVFRAVDGGVHELSCFGGAAKWTWTDLTAATHTPASISMPAAYQTHLRGQDPCARVVFSGTDSHIHELYHLGGTTGWEHRDLTLRTDAPPASTG